ncbi:MmcQ/YjbR family DNA-binding protein [Corynebacterium halotolerans]|uniref:TfoX N-terminal domain-containing protein n=1 Tax=Corynebacterium halotolerans YIM 70093 = DSM 44683 TaxID=1121362 RepID=M1NZ48_9CORY|nr:MmcQ/YjbR family DNA-binding protein [Corynebacterium halotolerans]AGF72795.1 hypothetical protein A605_08965 [Corynebacterium halotolerans YIM 70093 = DSM 44683]
MDGEGRVRRAATRPPEVTEKTFYGTPGFHAAGRIFARPHEEPGVLVCGRPDPEDKKILLRSGPEKLFPTDHYRGHASVPVRLDRVDDGEPAEFLAEAWKTRAPKRSRP